MAVQARHVSHAFLVDSAFPDEFTRCAPPAAAAGMVDTTRLRDFPRSNLTMCNHEFEPRKRARVAAAGDGFLVEDLQRVSLLPPAAVAQGSCTVQQVPVGRAADVASGSSGLLLWRLLYNQGADIDAFIRLESERMRVGLEEQRRRYTRALLAAASGRLRAAEAELERALRRNAELEDRARQAAAECEAWAGLARGHEVVAAGLRATLNQLLLQSPCAATVPVGEGDAEDAQSCCFEPPDGGDGAACQSARAAASSCKACRGAEACVLLLPCRHLCLCQACDAAVDACPVCTAAKNSSLHVLLS